MTVLLWVLAILALPAVGFGLYIAFVFVKEFIKHDPDAPDENAGAEAAAKLGLLPVSRLDLDRPGVADPAAEAVLQAVRRGDWEAGARFLAEAGRDWEERGRRVSILGHEAAKEDAWLLAWRSARPGDADAALVNADSMIYLAWDVRGSLQAKNTTREQFDSFHRILAQAREACAEAQALGGDDPNPYVVEMPLAMGLGYSHKDFNELWDQAMARAPHHLGAHQSALKYWCAKWRGSHELALSFAREAAAKGAPGQLLTLVLLDAHFEFEFAHSDLDEDEYYKRPELMKAVDAALLDLAAAAAEAGDPKARRLLPMRHMLAYMLYWQDRYEAAMEQFQLIDGHIGTTPWTYLAGNPRFAERYVAIRDFTAQRVLEAAEARTATTA
ncbi:hypothetical protein [Streptomyces sp. CO7]